MPLCFLGCLPTCSITWMLLVNPRMGRARVLHQLHAIRARPELLKVLLFKENPKKRED